MIKVGSRFMDNYGYIHTIKKINDHTYHLECNGNTASIAKWILESPAEWSMFSPIDPWDSIVRRVVNA